MTSPAIAGDDSRCGIALRVFLGESSAISCQYPYPISELPVKRCPSLAPEQGTRKVLTKPPGLRERRCGLGSGILSGWHASAVSGLAVGQLRGA